MKFRLLVAMIVAIILSAMGCSSDGGEDPATVLEQYVAAYNSGDADAVMAFYSEESVMIGHPAAPKLTGLTQIRLIQIDQDLAYAATENAYAISNVEVQGDTVTWDHVWVNDLGEEFCQVGQTAVIKDGKFLTWTWPGTTFTCR